MRGRSFVAAGTTLLLAGLVLGLRDLTRIAVLLLVLPLLTALVAGRGGANLHVRRDTDPVRVAAGDQVTVNVVVTNRDTRRAPALLAEEVLPPELAASPRFLLAPLAPGERSVIGYRLAAQVRGRHPLGPLRVQVRDPFGLTARFVAVGGAGELVVLPRIHPLPAGRAGVAGLGTEGEIPHMVAVHGEDDQSIRDYRDGDDLRRIHWPATARAGELMVRQEDRPARRRAVVLLDPRAAGYAGAGAAECFEWAVSAAASVVAHLAGTGYSVHTVTAEGAEPAHAGASEQLAATFDALAETRTRDDISLEAMARAAHAVADDGGLVVAVLGGADAHGVHTLASVRRPGASGLALVVDGSAAPGAALSVLSTAGWRATAVPPSVPIAQAWSRVRSQRAPNR